MPQTSCKAILFDLDGVLIDSDSIYERHWARWAEEMQVSFEHILAIHHGRPAVQTMAIVAPHLDPIQASKQFNEILATDMNMDGLVAFEGAKALLQHLPSHRWAIATSAPRDVAILRLTHLGLPIPPIFVTADDVQSGKPAPDPYLQAAQGLGFDPSHCLVVEDSPAGITSAKAATAQAIAITSTHAAEALGEADAIISDLQGLQVTVADHELQVSWNAPIV